MTGSRDRPRVSPMRKVAILIPASPSRGFFSQIAVFSRALRKLDWRRWVPRLHVFMGGEVDIEALRDWLPYLDDVQIVLLPLSRFLSEGISAQDTELHHWLPDDADVILVMDADTLPVGDFEDVLDRVVETASVAGVMAFGGLSREAWRHVADGLISVPLEFAYSYSLQDGEMPEAERPSPFYVNGGVVFFPASLFPDFAQCFLRLREKLPGRVPRPYLAGQFAIALAIAEIRARTWALPMRYNCPNDEHVETRFPEELRHVRIFHYLRTEAFDRQKIFTDPMEYSKFLGLELSGVNKIFQQEVERIVGSEYPFRELPRRARISAPPAQTRISGPLSQEAYQSALREHELEIAPNLRRIDEEMRRAAIAGADPAASKQMATCRLLLNSGLFDADFYLRTYAVV